jgi:hypothetical protein
VRYTQEEVQYIITHYATTTNSELGCVLGRHADRIASKAHKMGLKKDKEFLIEQAKNRPNSGQFKKGFTPFNKGQKLSQATKDKLKPTMFKRGNRPHNTLNVGDEREDKDGYVWVKVAEPSEWKLKHHVAFGEEVPAGFKVIFIDGNKRNFERSNLALISDADLMRQNTNQRFPTELRNLIRTLNKLKKRVTENA